MSRLTSLTLATGAVLLLAACVPPPHSNSMHSHTGNNMHEHDNVSHDHAYTDRTHVHSTTSLDRNFYMVDEAGNRYGTVELDARGNGRLVDSDGRVHGYVVVEPNGDVTRVYERTRVQHNSYNPDSDIPTGGYHNPRTYP